jgi:hypothetical protein
MTIEHIMPQTLSERWKEHLSEHWAVIHELIVHSLENLTIWNYYGKCQLLTNVEHAEGR